MALRWTYRWELHHLLEVCGLAVAVSVRRLPDSAITRRGYTVVKLTYFGA
jgi:hypothetical protein